MIQPESAASRTIAIRREAVATFAQLVNEGSSARGLLSMSKRRQDHTRYNGTDLEMHFTLLPYERRFRMDAATFRKRHDSGEILNYPIPSEAGMVTFLGLCDVATEHYNGLLARRPYQTLLKASA